MVDFKAKKILFISPSFFGYEKSILNRLREMGAIVDYFDERPANTFWTKSLIRINSKLLVFTIDKYYQSISSYIYGKEYDYIFVVNIEAMPRHFLKMLKNQYPNTKFILYMWDSIMNKRKTISYIPFFDVVFSFDADDCKKNPYIKFRPLFYLNEYQSIISYNRFKYDLLFIGTAHSDRYSFLQKIQVQPDIRNKKCYFYLYLQDWKLFLWYKVVNPIFRKAHMKDFRYIPLTKLELINLIKQSRIIIDIQHPNQVGLTIRTIEMLGAGRKLITTNKLVETYDFYDPNNILIIDRDNPVIPEQFFYTDYIPVDQKIYEKYSLDGWLNDVFVS